MLLDCRVDEEGEGLALDGLLHGQEVIGKTRACWCSRRGVT